MSEKSNLEIEVAESESTKEDEKSFEELGLDSRLIRALSKKGVTNPTPIQRSSIPLILEGKDVITRAHTGSGKTFAYLLPVLQKLFAEVAEQKKLAPVAFIVVPTRELCQQVYNEAMSLIELCRVHLKVVQFTTDAQITDLKVALAGRPDILVSTPGGILKCLNLGVLQGKQIQDSLSVLVLDEADLLLSFGHGNDLKALTVHIPRRCQCLLMSATISEEVENLARPLLHNPYILTLRDHGNEKDDIVSKNIQQYYIKCSSRDKLVHILALLKLELVQKKVLIFTNTIDMSFRLKLFLEQFGIKSAVFNSELPLNSRKHIIEGFSAGLFDYMIATDDGDHKEKEQDGDGDHAAKKKSKRHAKDAEAGVARGIDFKNVHTVINFDMPQSAVRYVHRIGRTGRAYDMGESVSLVAPEEENVFEEIEALLGENGSDSNAIAKFRFPTDNAVESLRYRAEDVARSVTKIAVRESRAQDLRNEILNSEKLKAHFQNNPKDLDLLKHDKPLSKKAPAPHLRDVPAYLLDPTTQEASNIVKLASSVMRKINNSSRRRGSQGKSKNRDPLKSFSAEGHKNFSKGGMKRKGNDGDSGKKHKRKHT
ncbi:DEAD-box ATP-dependent RNA helicase 16 [Apium graveolens]|uniref:DEAD-box ATP-dependent RNA helicase 16 n=1 Tax=Apium graveolens TaxID=4045 RepID=UPI003D7B07B8